ncbi:MAG: response regulator [candidate division Zixibacteria bacterium]|nr:response regulator [candidate division Zixibacteria bacterium]
MSEERLHTILVVDDERGILKALRRLLKSLEAEVITVDNGPQALEILKNTEVSLIISDQRMPKMTGVDFCARAKALRPDSIRILLTGYADIDATVEAINRGSVEYYISKPWDDDALLSRIKESLNMYDIIVENRELQELTQIQNAKLKDLNENLQQKVDEQTYEIQERHAELRQSFMETIKALSNIIEHRSEEVGSHSTRVANLVKLMLADIDLDSKRYQDIVVSAFLHDIGKISIPDKILMRNRGELSNAELEVVKKHVILGQSCVLAITGFEEIGIIIRHHHEHFDGSGYPDSLSENTIPLGSRIIHLADAFDHLAFVKGYPNSRGVKDATAELVRFSGTRYDSDLVKKFVEKEYGNSYLHREPSKIVRLKVQDLQPDMVVAGDVFTHNGMFLLPKDAKLSAGMIKRIKNINRYDHIEKGVPIFAPSSKREMLHA